MKYAKGNTAKCREGTYLNVKGSEEKSTRVALVGNPNVGKSTLFNGLTGMNQHTGNWAGKTVELAFGERRICDESFLFVDLPGTYSLYAHSKEEEVAAEYILRGEYDIALVVLDSTMPTRSMILALEVMDVTDKVALVFNFSGAAKKQGVEIDYAEAERTLGVPVISLEARQKKTYAPLFDLLKRVAGKRAAGGEDSVPQMCHERDEAVCIEGEAACIDRCTGCAEQRSSCDRAACGKPLVQHGSCADCNICKERFTKRGEKPKEPTSREPITQERVREVTAPFIKAEGGRCRRDVFLDRIFTGRYTAFVLMGLVFFFILYLTVVFANYPSELLSRVFELVGYGIVWLLEWLQLPSPLVSFLYDGVYTVLAEVVSVMLPPMAIFFPLFTLLEDSGLLPRFAYNSDAPFRCVGACGKQGLTMCMGLGCNSTGVMGCRIIDSPRERRIAILTNALMPCNGRFPTLLLLLSILMGGGSFALLSLGLLLVICLGVLGTFLVSFILCHTVCRGEPSFFTIEMPPYRSPDVKRVLTRSFIDRTLVVLGRAIPVATIAGAALWLLTSIQIDGVGALYYLADFLDPLGRALGFDGVMLSAFILGWPAGEIVIPIALMGYSGMGSAEALSLSDASGFLAAQGWTPLTAISVIIFTLFHWPCTTTLITIYKETGKARDVLLAAVLPTLLGGGICFLLNLIF